MHGARHGFFCPRSSLCFMFLVTFFFIPSVRRKAHGWLRSFANRTESYVNVLTKDFHEFEFISELFSDRHTFTSKHQPSRAFLKDAFNSGRVNIVPVFQCVFVP